MKHAIYAAAAASLFLLSGPIAAQTPNLMDTSGGVAVPSPAIAFVPGYPRPSDGAASITREKRKTDDAFAGDRLKPAHVALQPANPAPLRD